MTENTKLDAALRSADQLVASSLRQEEQRRALSRERFYWGLAAFAAFVAGTGTGAGLMYARPVVPPNLAVKTVSPTALVAPASISSGAATAMPTTGTANTDRPPVTGPCEVKWGGKWMKANILKREADIALVKYDGWDDFFNEWVRVERIRPLGSTRNDIGYAKPTPHGEKPVATTKPS